MAQWQALLKLDSALQSRVCQLYEKRFPREIRHYLCVWIENQDWDSAAVDEYRARTCFQALLVFLEEQWNRSIQENIILQGPDFSSMKDYLLVGDLTLLFFSFFVLQIVQRQLVNILKQTHQVVETLTDVELPEWKRRQQLACIGSPAETSLDHLEKWFSTVAEVLLGVHEQLKKLQDLNSKYSITDNIDLPASISEIEKFALPLLMKLLTNALVVVKQPVMQKFPQRPLILKTGVQFICVRVSARWTNVQYRGESPWHSGCMNFNLEFKIRSSLLLIRQSVCSFIDRVPPVLLVQASSLPVVVISSTSQVPSAWASIMWWNMLSTSEPWNLSLFINPPPLTWEQLSQALSWQFLTVGQRGLDENQLSMLRDKINENTWIWIDGILDLIKKHLVDLWRDGSIMGFVSRERTRLLLQEKQAGNFLIRFSESSKDGAVTFSWVDQSNGGMFLCVFPYTKKELSVSTLPDIIYRYSLSSQRSRNPLVYLYPDIPKDTAFGRYKSCGITSLNVNISNDAEIIQFTFCLMSPITSVHTDPSAPSGDGYHLIHIDSLLLPVWDSSVC
uniref:Signal transducer and activator of transcription 1b n=1 Tax=Amphilophus citrinellus TaxID=61819 RepID=A0A3Q0RCX9_AMPCI